MDQFLNKLKFWGAIAVVGFILLWMMVGAAIKWVLVIAVPVFIVLWAWGTWMPKKIKERKRT